MRDKYRHLLWGVLAGLMGGFAAAFILWGSWLLPTMGLILTRSSLITGMVSMLIIGVLGGLLFALIIGKRRLSLPASIMAGLGAGIILWVFGILILIPLALGLEPVLANPQDHLVPLVALLFYGLILGLVYNRGYLSESRRAWHTAVAALAVAVLLMPFMLRAAFTTNPADLSLPEGFKAEVVVKGFTYPTSITTDEEGNIFVAEAGFAYGPKTTNPRILFIDEQGRFKEIQGEWNEPINGLAFKDNKLYISHRGMISELDLTDGSRKDLVEGLPSLGDHHNNELVFGPDGALYFGQGTATNAGVVGSDNFIYAWADRESDFHDIPSRKFELTGENYEDLDLSTVDPQDTVTTGAFTPFGESTEEGDTVEGQIKASGTILRYDLETEELSVYADGLRNPYGLAVNQDGTIYATNMGYDDRGVRAVKGSPDWVVEVKEGAWYGWPDYAGTEPLNDPKFASERGTNLNPLISDPPEVEEPVVSFPPHYSPTKLAFPPEDFPLAELFVAVFGDGQPLTEDIDEIRPTGVLIVDVETGEYDWFAQNKNNARAGRFESGFKRVVDVEFCTKNEALYVLDFGVMEFTDLAPNAIPQTGVLWRITPDPVRVGLREPAEEEPIEEIPFVPPLVEPFEPPVEEPPVELPPEEPAPIEPEPEDPPDNDIDEPLPEDPPNNDVEEPIPEEPPNNNNEAPVPEEPPDNEIEPAPMEPENNDNEEPISENN